MHLRVLGILAIFASTAPAQSPEGGAGFNQITPMRSGDARSFQFREDIDCMAEQLVAYVSWAPPDRRCVILCDRVDGLPLMIAVDGKVWMYDLIGGQILLIRAEPQLLARVSGDVMQNRWGIRADFPDQESRRTIDVDPATIIGSLSRHSPEAIRLDTEQKFVEASHGNARATLWVDKTEPTQPLALSLKMGDANSRAELRFDSFVFGEKAPAWHHALDQQKLAKRVPVVAVAESNALSPEAQQRLTTFRRLLQGGGLFILRSALRDDQLRRAIEKNSPIQLDFATIRANHEKLKDAWRDALSEQGIDVNFQKSPATSGPAASTRP